MQRTGHRIDWVDTAKGICIIFVVMFQATLGVQVAMGETGWMNYVILFAWPFRMPDFFVLSGLFLGVVIDRPWLRYIDRKVVHFAYFFALWVAIEVALKSPDFIAEGGNWQPLHEYLFAFVQPYGSLWFIYMLPVFFVFTRLVRNVPVWFVLSCAALLEILPVETGSAIIDEFCWRYVFFYGGYVFAARIFDIAAWMRAHKARALVLVGIWIVAQTAIVFAPVPDTLQIINFGNSGFSGMPFVSLALGAIGALAIVTVATLLVDLPYTAWLTWLGEHSLVIYLGYYVPVTAARMVLTRSGLVDDMAPGSALVSDIGTMSVLTMLAGIVGPVILYWLIQQTGWGRFLFERPQWARLEPAPRRVLAPAE